MMKAVIISARVHRQSQ